MSLLVGCSGASSDGVEVPEASGGEGLAACETPECREAWVTEHAEDEGKVAKALLALEDPVVRLALLRHLRDTKPAEVSGICRILGSRGPDEICLPGRSRPHLHAEAPSAPSAGESETARAAGRLKHYLTVAPLPDPRAGVVGVMPELCAERTEEALRLCVGERADKAFVSGDLDAALAACRAIDDDRWQAECTFQTAEGEIRPKLLKGPPSEAQVRSASAMCLSAARYQANCFDHIAGYLAWWVPLNNSELSYWAALERNLAASREVVDDEVVSEIFEEEVWVMASFRAIAGRVAIRPDLAEGLPDRARTHLRAAFAWSMMAEGQEGDLATLVKRLEEHEAGARSELVTGRKPRKTAPVTSWRLSLPEESELPSVPYWGPLRRTTGENDDADRQIGILEAAAQTKPPRLGLVAQGLESEHDRVRWTAVRLLSCIDEEGEFTEEVKAKVEDPSAPVRARAEAGCDRVDDSHGRRDPGELSGGAPPPPPPPQ